MTNGIKCGYLSCLVEPGDVYMYAIRSCHYCQKMACDSCIYNNRWTRDDDGCYQCEMCQDWKYRRMVTNERINAVGRVEVLKRA